MTNKLSIQVTYLWTGWRFQSYWLINITQVLILTKNKFITLNYVHGLFPFRMITFSWSFCLKHIKFEKLWTFLLENKIKILLFQINTVGPCLNTFRKQPDIKAWLAFHSDSYVKSTHCNVYDINAKYIILFALHTNRSLNFGFTANNFDYKRAYI